ncbi:MAG: serine/threonine-protein kinase [Planctomycetia bacterium]|nr:serine/threonine-protein kinase [Planctomycetia bacterium]
MRFPFFRSRQNEVGDRPMVRLVESVGSRFTEQRFSDETTQLLHGRLTAVVLATTLIFGIPFLWDLVVGVPGPLPVLRGINLTISVPLLVALIRWRRLPVPVLRTIEYGVYAITSFQMILLLWAGMSARLADGAPEAAAVYAHVVLASWAILLMTFAVLLPNTWKRAFTLLLIMSLFPYLATWWMTRYAVPGDAVPEHIRHMRYFFERGVGTLLPVSLFAVLAGTYCAHVLYSVRRQMFRSQQLGQYRLTRKIGSGGMGEVWEAEHQLLRRPCAVKLIRAEKVGSPVTLARFEREARETSRLTHFNTVEIYDCGRAQDGTFYCVMELLRGLSIEELVRRHGTLSAGRTIWFLRQVCGALREAHGKGLIHRDIKPANIFAAERGGVHDVAKLLDFGLVRRIHGTVDPWGTGAGTGTGVGTGTKIERSGISGELKTTATESRSTETLSSPGKFCGTPFYMCPEQVENYANLDARSDIYSLGATSYYMLTGRPPFTGESVRETMRQHLRCEVPPLRLRNPDVPEDLERVVLKCLAKRPVDRFENVDDLSRALDSCADAKSWSDAHAEFWWRQVATPTFPKPDPDSPTLDAVPMNRTPILPGDSSSASTTSGDTDLTESR